MGIDAGGKIFINLNGVSFLMGAATAEEERCHVDLRLELNNEVQLVARDKSTTGTLLYLHDQTVQTLKKTECVIPKSGATLILPGRQKDKNIPKAQVRISYEELSEELNEDVVKLVGKPEKPITRAEKRRRNESSGLEVR